MPDSPKLPAKHHTKKPESDTHKHHRRTKRKPAVQEEMIVRTPAEPAKSPVNLTDSDTPKRTAPAILRTTYDTRRIRIVLIGGVAMIVVVAGLMTWYWRKDIAERIDPSTTAEPVYQLRVEKETIDQDKLQSIGLPPRGPQASQSVTISGAQPASENQQLEMPSQAELESYSYAQLDELLQNQLNQLRAEGQQVGPIESLRARSQKERADSKNDQALDTLRSAILLADEFQRLYLYYQK